MIAKWDIKPVPVAKNKERHKLLIKGDMKDIFFIVKKLGSICSRPQKSAGDFNFTIYLSKMDTDIMVKLKQVTSELSILEKQDASIQTSEWKIKHIEKSSVAKSDMEPVRVEASAGADKSAIKEDRVKEDESKEDKAKEDKAKEDKAKEDKAKEDKAKEDKAKEDKAKEDKAKEDKAKEDKAKEDKAKEDKAKEDKAKEDKAKEDKAKEDKAKEDKAKEDKVLPSPSSSMRGLSVPSSKDTQRIKKYEKEIVSVEALEGKEAEKKKEDSGIRRKKLLQTKWSMELPMIPVCNFENFVAGSHNRFAHAAAMAVVENPGVMYNPLLIFGIPGTGKTHFIHSIAYGLAANLGHQNIFVTDGIKLSRGLDLAIRDGLTDKLEEIFAQVKALVIDDIHLLMITARNKKFLSKLMNDFISRDKQIVVTSLFPPQALGKLENQLGFQLTQGWMVDLKIPNTDKYETIVTKMIDSVDIKLSAENIDKLFIKDMVPLGDVVEILEQVKKLEKLIAVGNTDVSYGKLLKMLMEKSSSAGNDLLEDDINKAEEFKLQEKDNWFKWGIFYPKGCLKSAKWIIYSLYEKAKELGIAIEWNQIFMEEYNSDESYGVPFEIADFSSEKKANGIIVMGPQYTSVLGAQEQQFKHLSKKIFTSFFIKSSWISANQLKNSASYVKILMDLI